MLSRRSHFGWHRERAAPDTAACGRRCRLDFPAVDHGRHRNERAKARLNSSTDFSQREALKPGTDALLHMEGRRSGEERGGSLDGFSATIEAVMSSEAKKGVRLLTRTVNCHQRTVRVSTNHSISPSIKIAARSCPGGEFRLVHREGVSQERG